MIDFADIYLWASTNWEWVLMGGGLLAIIVFVRSMQ